MSSTFHHGGNSPSTRPTHHFSCWLLATALLLAITPGTIEAQDDKDEEKPKLPKSTLISVALYYYPRTTLSEIDRYLAEGNNPDQPGQLIQWLYPQTTVRTWPIPGQWLDIGSHETLAEARKIFEAM